MNDTISLFNSPRHALNYLKAQKNKHILIDEVHKVIHYQLLLTCDSPIQKAIETLLREGWIKGGMKPQMNFGNVVNGHAIQGYIYAPAVGSSVVFHSVDNPYVKVK